MSNSFPISIITSMYSVPYATLTPQLWQLTHQAVKPLEILIVCASPDRDYRAGLHDACAPFDLVRVVDAPQYGASFSASEAYNVGIKHSSADSDFVSCMAAGLLFSEHSLEGLRDVASLEVICEAPMANLPGDYKLGDVETLWQRWEDMLSHTDSVPPLHHFSPGSLSCISRAWMFKAHGYDEINYPIAYSDSDLLWRAKVDGLRLQVVPWGKMQMIHITHPTRYPLTTAPDGSDRSIVRNGERWGELQGEAVA